MDTDRITNNLITNMGLHVTYGGGVYVHQAHDILVEHNEISWSQRYLHKQSAVACDPQAVCRCV